MEDTHQYRQESNVKGYLPSVMDGRQVLGDDYSLGSLGYSMGYGYGSVHQSMVGQYQESLGFPTSREQKAYESPSSYMYPHISPHSEQRSQELMYANVPGPASSNYRPYDINQHVHQMSGNRHQGAFDAVYSGLSSAHGTALATLQNPVEANSRHMSEDSVQSKVGSSPENISDVHMQQSVALAAEEGNSQSKAATSSEQAAYLNMQRHLESNYRLYAEESNVQNKTMSSSERTPYMNMQSSMETNSRPIISESGARHISAESVQNKTGSSIEVTAHSTINRSLESNYGQVAYERDLQNNVANNIGISHSTLHRPVEGNFQQVADGRDVQNNNSNSNTIVGSSHSSVHKHMETNSGQVAKTDTQNKVTNTVAEVSHPGLNRSIESNFRQIVDQGGLQNKAGSGSISGSLPSSTHRSQEAGFRQVPDARIRDTNSAAGLSQQAMHRPLETNYRHVPDERSSQNNAVSNNNVGTSSTKSKPVETTSQLVGNQRGVSNSAVSRTTTGVQYASAAAMYFNADMDMEDDEDDDEEEEEEEEDGDDEDDDEYTEMEGKPDYPIPSRQSSSLSYPMYQTFSEKFINGYAGMLNNENSRPDILGRGLSNISDSKTPLSASRGYEEKKFDPKSVGSEKLAAVGACQSDDVKSPKSDQNNKQHKTCTTTEESNAPETVKPRKRGRPKGSKNSIKQNKDKTNATPRKSRATTKTKSSSKTTGVDENDEGALAIGQGNKISKTAIKQEKSSDKSVKIRIDDVKEFDRQLKTKLMENFGMDSSKESKTSKQASKETDQSQPTGCYLEDPTQINPEDDSFKSGEDTAKKTPGVSYLKPGEKGYTCKVCNNTYNRASYLKQHMRKHTGERPFKCYYCDRTYAISSHRMQHMRIHTGERPFKCQFCDKTFPMSTQCKVHMRTHTGERPFICSMCDKGFTIASQLKVHMRVHTGDRQYKCTECEKAFTRSCHLRQHLLRHAGSKPFKCTECGKGFQQSWNLNQHMLTHTRVKDYKCSVCEREFALPSHLKRHMRIHTGERPYVCQVCGKGFIDSAQLKLHIKANHKEANPIIKCYSCSEVFEDAATLMEHMPVHTSQKIPKITVIGNRTHVKAVDELGIPYTGAKVKMPDTVSEAPFYIAPLQIRNRIAKAEKSAAAKSSEKNVIRESCVSKEADGSDLEDEVIIHHSDASFDMLKDSSLTEGEVKGAVSENEEDADVTERDIADRISSIKRLVEDRSVTYDDTAEEMEYEDEQVMVKQEEEEEEDLEEDNEFDEDEKIDDDEEEKVDEKVESLPKEDSDSMNMIAVDQIKVEVKDEYESDD